MNMTYKELQEAIERMSEDQKNQNATVFVSGINEYFPIERMYVEPVTDVLDAGHIVMETPVEEIA